VCATSPGEQDQPLTGVDVLDAVYIVVVNFVAPLLLMAFFYSRIYRTVRLHKMSVILRDVLITEVVPGLRRTSEGDTTHSGLSHARKRPIPLTRGGPTPVRGWSCSPGDVTSPRWWSVVQGDS